MYMFRVPVGSYYDVKSFPEENNIKWDTACGTGKVCTHIAKGPWLTWDMEHFDNGMMTWWEEMVNVSVYEQ